MFSICGTHPCRGVLLIVCDSILNGGIELGEAVVELL